MSASYAAKGSRRWRYYVSRAVLSGSAQDAGSVVRVSAPAIENRVVRAIEAYVAAQAEPRRPILRGATENERLRQPQTEPASHDTIRNAIERVTLSASWIEIILGDSAFDEERDRVLTIPWTPRSAHRQREIIHAIDQSDDRPTRRMRGRARQVFVDAMRDAHCWLNELLAYPTSSVGSIAARVGRSERSIRMTLSLAFLAPDLAKAATEGRLPRGFGIKRTAKSRTCRDFCFGRKLRRFLRTERWWTQSCETCLRKPKSLLTGKRTGNFAKMSASSEIFGANSLPKSVGYARIRLNSKQGI